MQDLDQGISQARNTEFVLDAADDLDGVDVSSHVVQQRRDEVCTKFNIRLKNLKKLKRKFRLL